MTYSRPTHRAATGYLQIAGRPPGPSRWDDGKGATVVAVTSKKPESVRPGCIVIKVRFNIPAEAWDPFTPSAVVDVPADLIQAPISAVAQNANEED